MSRRRQLDANYNSQWWVESLTERKKSFWGEHRYRWHRTAKTIRERVRRFKYELAVYVLVTFTEVVYSLAMKTELYVHACKHAYLWRLTWSALRWRCCGTAGMDCGGDGLHRSKVATCYRSSSRSTESCRADDETQNEDSGADNGWQPSTGKLCCECDCCPNSMKADFDESWASRPSAIAVMVIIKCSALRALTPYLWSPNESLRCVRFFLSLVRRYCVITATIYPSCPVILTRYGGKVGLSKGRDFKVDSVKFESLLPDLMQPLQVKWFVSKGQRLPIGHST